MWEIKDAVIITNNDWVREKYKTMFKIIFVESYEDVLIKTRDMVRDRHDMLTHPQASSREANRTPYRSVIVCPDDGDSNESDILLIEKCLAAFYQWQELSPAPERYTDRVMRDFKVFDLSMMDSVIPKLFPVGTG